MAKDKLSKAFDDQQVLMQAMQKEMTGLKMLIDTVRALIETLVAKGLITKEEVAKKLGKNFGK